MSEESRRDKRKRRPAPPSKPARSLHEFNCAQCGRRDLVPFKPDPGRRLLCSACKQAQNSRPKRAAFDVVCSNCGAHDTVPFEPFPGSVVLCRRCKDNPELQRVGGRILHNIVCNACGKTDQVPFKPDPGSRVLCRTCHLEQREAKRASQERRAANAAANPHITKVRIEIRCDRCGADDVLSYVPKTNGPILCRVCAANTFSEQWVRRHGQGAPRRFPFRCERCGKQAFAFERPNEDQDLLCSACNDEIAALHTDRLESREAVDSFLFVRRQSRDGSAPPVPQHGSAGQQPALPPSCDDERSSSPAVEAPPGDSARVEPPELDATMPDDGGAEQLEASLAPFELATELPGEESDSGTS